MFQYTHVGVEINGAANILAGVHTWNGGGVGIAINAYQNRLVACYLDFNTLTIADPSETVVENTFFLETHTVFHAAKGTVSEVQMRFNTYTGGDSVVLDGTFTRATHVSITDEINGNKLTTVRATQHQDAGTVFTFDFSSTLLFPWIDHVVFSLAEPSGSVTAVARPPVGRVVQVVTSSPVNGTVSIVATQCI